MAEEQTKETKETSEAEETKEAKDSKKAPKDEKGKKWGSEIKKLGDKIVGLTLMQAKELGDYLKDEYGIEPAAGGAVMMAGPATQGQAEQEEALRGPRLPNPPIDRCEASEQERHEQRVDPDPDLQQAVDPKRTDPGPPEPPSRHEGAERQTTHESGEDGARRELCRAEDEDQLAQPDHLVNQRGPAGKQE